MTGDEVPTSITVAHITIKPAPGDRIEGSCEKCGMGIKVGASFGPIPGDVLLAEWVKQHAHKRRNPRRSP